MHWTSKYVSKPYIEGEFDCADLARLIQKNECGKEIRLPATRDYRGQKGVARIRAMERQIAVGKQDYAVSISAPEEYCAVLLRDGSKLGHIGTYTVINNEAWVLHITSAFGSATMSRVRDLDRVGLKVEGYYRWI